MSIPADDVKTLFGRALLLPEPAAREAFLAEACGDNESLRAEVKGLLEAMEMAGDFLKRKSGSEGRTGDFESKFQPTASVGPPADSPTESLPDKDEHIGELIDGKYKLIEEIGAGGMGSVYMAQQTEPVKRAVAVKVIKAGMDSKAVLARFSAERQALALMDHPNIARVLDAGATENGRPYFVMELVKGIPITQFCDAHKLTPRQRLELFVPVCQAIQHAHQKGVIHRDIKPSNVLVALYDDRPVPKVIDFGIAKAAGQPLTDQTLMTGYGAVVGTPEYMSPEQASFNQVDVDTRSDVYSLGVLLYELLTGSTPVDRKNLGKAALLEILRIVREVEAPRPSAKLSTIDTLPNVAANRGIEPSKLSKLMRGELDWVLLKALEKDRARRYETANALGCDIQRYLADELVEARPPSKAYRIKKYVRRHKGQVIAASLVFFALLAGIAGTTLGLFEARNQEKEAKRQEQIARDETTAKEQARLAEAERAEGERQAKEQAIARLGEVKKSNEILGAIFDSLDPNEIAKADRPLQAILVEKLEKAAAQLDGKAIGDQIVVANMQARLARSLIALGEPKKAVDLLEKARKTLENQLGADKAETLSTRLLLAYGYQSAGKLKLALEQYQQTHEQAQRILGPNHLITTKCMHDLAYCYVADGQIAPAVPLYQRTLEWRKKNLGPDHPYTLANMSNLAMAYKDDGKFKEAVSLSEKTLELTKAKFGPKDPNTLHAMSGLALAYEADGNANKALPLLEDALKLRKELLGDSHSDTLGAINNLAIVYQKLGKSEEARLALEDLLKSTKAKFGADHPDTLTVMLNLVTAYMEARKNDKALPIAEDAVQLSRAKLGPNHPTTLICVSNLGTLYFTTGKSKEALPLLKETLERHKEKLGADHPDTLMIMNNLAGCYLNAGQIEMAIPLMEQVFANAKAKLGLQHPNTVKTMLNLASMYQQSKKLDKAVPLLEEAFKILKTFLPPEHPLRVGTTNALIRAYEEAGTPERAIPIYQELLDRKKEKLGPEHRETLNAANKLARQYWIAKQLDKSIPIFEDVAKRSEAKFGRKNEFTLMALGNLGVNYMDAGNLDKAIPLLEEACGTETKTLIFQNLAPQLLIAYVKASMAEKAKGIATKVLEEIHRQFPKDSSELASQLAKLGFLVLQAQAFEQAEPVLRECLAIREKNKPDDWLTFNTHSLLGGALSGQKKYGEAEPLLLKGYEGMKQREKSIPPGAMIRLPEAIDRLIELYTATKKPDEVKKWQAERDKFPTSTQKAPQKK